MRLDTSQGRINSLVPSEFGIYPVDFGPKASFGLTQVGRT